MDTYEKKYNEALERARKAYNAIPPESRGARKIIEDAFPELRESEDERMMREFNDWLCEEIECRTNDLRDEKDRRTLNMLCYILTKVKDWLEKQQESLHVQETCKENADSFTDEDEKLRKLVIDRIRTATEMTEGLRELLLDYLEKQKEPENTSATTMAPSCWEVEQKEQKPAEWSEDFDTLFEEYYDQHPDGLTLEECGRFFYEKGKEICQEWSEEDERILKGIIGKIDHDQTYGVSKKDMLSFLESLRPSWKPSDEQLEALRLSFEEAFDDAGDCNRYRFLKSLYEQLKKL